MLSLHATSLFLNIYGKRMSAYWFDTYIVVFVHFTSGKQHLCVRRWKVTEEH